LHLRLSTDVLMDSVFATLTRLSGPDGNPDFDGKRPRKTMMRKTVDYNSSFLNMIQNRVWQRDHRDRSVFRSRIWSLVPQHDPDESLGAGLSE